MQLLDQGWEATATAPGARHRSGRLDELALAPGTGARHRGGRARGRGGAGGPGERDLDAEDWWFRTTLRGRPGGGRRGGACSARRDRDGRRGLPQRRAGPARASRCSLEHAVDVGALLRERERAGDPLPRARARCWPSAASRAPAGGRASSREGNLRFFRTMLLGRAPGLRARAGRRSGPGGRCACERRRGLALDELALRTAPRRRGRGARLPVRGRALDGDLPGAIEAELAGRRAPTARRSSCSAAAGWSSPRASWWCPSVARWWPHTHGEPALHRGPARDRRRTATRSVDAGRVGFRTVAAGSTRPRPRGRRPRTCRSTASPCSPAARVWTPVDWLGLAPSEAELRADARSRRATPG